MSDTPIYPHDPIDEIQPDVFMVRGEIKMNALMTITRNMAIVRHQGELTLIDPLRLDASEEKRLEEMGAVKRILRLGSLHGVDDPYYVDRYGAELWAPGLSQAHPEPKPTLEWDESTPLPFPDAQLFRFEGLNQPEGALLLKRGKGLLLTCDGIQNYGDYSHCNLATRIISPWIGFPKTTIVGPIWVKMMTPKGGNLESEFRRLLELEFDQLLSAHGTFLESGAHGACKRAVDKVFAR
jgi:hypothetical protein